MLGLILMLLGAWGGIVAYVGPLFDYRMTPDPAWAWTTSHWELHAAPGAAVVLGGLLVLIASPRVIARLGAVLGLLGGLWLVVGPLFASMWLGADSETQVASTTLSQAVRPLGYHYGTGALIVAVAAYAWAACAAYARTLPYPDDARRAPTTVEDDELASILGRDE
jgi:hypothetical protein